MTVKQKQILKDKLQHYLDDFEHWCSRDDRYEKPCVWFETITRGNKVYFLNEFLFDIHAINVDEYLANYDEELKAQIEQLSNDNHILKTSFITQQEQIEKMKCYLNCANNSDECLGKNCYGCKNWELAE